MTIWSRSKIGLCIEMGLKQLRVFYWKIIILSEVTAYVMLQQHSEVLATRWAALNTVGLATRFIFKTNRVDFVMQTFRLAYNISLGLGKNIF